MAAKDQALRTNGIKRIIDRQNVRLKNANVQIIIGALGNVSKDIEKWLAEIDATCRLVSLQRARLLGTVRILRKVLIIIIIIIIIMRLFRDN